MLALFIIAALAINALAFRHAWSFTHYAAVGARPEVPNTPFGRLQLLLSGMTLPRPVPERRPAAYRSLRIPLTANRWLGAWTGAAIGPKRGTVLLFHGYGGEKSALVPEAEAFRALGWRVLLVDFQGSGESTGSDTTIGVREADDVLAAWQHVRTRWHEPAGHVVLFGVSLGAVACLRACGTEAVLQPAALVLECPFGTLYQTVVNRFRVLHTPPVPLAALLAFWGGAQHGFWAFAHNPTTYAAAVPTPTLLIAGTADERVTVAETRAVFAALAGPKTLALLPRAGHGHYLVSRDSAVWHQAVAAHLGRVPQ